MSTSIEAQKRFDDLDKMVEYVAKKLSAKQDLNEKRIYLPLIKESVTSYIPEEAIIIKSKLENVLLNQQEAYIMEFDSRSYIANNYFDYQIRGEFELKDENCEILFELLDSNKKSLGNVSVILTEKIIRLADNYSAARKSQKIFEASQSETPTLDLQAWTSRGEEAIYLEEGDFIYLYFKANKDCHIRLIYSLANGKRALLEDQISIKANEIIKYPDKFKCTSPYGIEFLDVFASDQVLESLEVVVEEQGNYRLINSSEEAALAINRGIKQKSNSTNASQVNAYGDKRIVLTTYSKKK